MGKQLVLIGVLLCGFGFAKLRAQEAVSATYGNATGNEGSVSYTVGQVFYKTFEGVNGSEAQGVQQPYEISVVLGLETNHITSPIQVYPNPALHYLTLEVDNQSTNQSYWLYSEEGTLLEYNYINEIETRLNMQNFAPGIYFLKIIKEGNNLKTFKILKR